MLRNKPKGILFDWDNTLADTWPIIHESLAKTFIAMGETPWTLEETKIRVHKSLRDSFPELFGHRWEEAKDLYMNNFRHCHLEKIRPLPGAHEMLKAIHHFPEVYLAVVSNKTGEFLRKEVEFLGWKDYFKKVVGALDAKRDKPAPDPVHLSLEGSGLEVGPDIWFIGDSLTDMQTAYATGCIPIFYGDGDHTGDEYKDVPPAVHVQHHQDIIEAIRHW
ncbi:MAG: HAD hydrolase-like protein [Alphaproteobacteria bacterium]|nr:HAD hydrolase-like protein [Alphaproteobacteria bacterium]